MWIKREQYERLLERLGDLERFQDQAEGKQAIRECQSIRSEMSYLRDHFRVLLDSLGLVHHRTPAKEEYVKKGGPERG